MVINTIVKGLTKMNNYNKIKNMSIEEMIEFLNEVDSNYCTYCTFHNTGCNGEYCFDGHKTWLLQEATND